MKYWLILLLCLFSFIGEGQIITTVVGNGTSGGSGDGGPATAATIGYPDGCAFDVYGNFYFTTVGNEKVRKVTPTGIISTIAGTGVSGYNGDGIAATAAQLNTTTAVAVDRFNNIYIADGLNNRIRKIDVVTGIISTIAGSTTTGFSGDGGPASSSQLFGPQDICFDGYGNLFISDENNQRIRKIDTNGIITTIAGNGIYGYTGDGGQATNAELSLVSGICLDKIGNLFVAQSGNYIIRKIDTTGIITTVAGNGLPGNTGDGGPATLASLSITRITVDNFGNLYISGSGPYIRKIDNSGIIHRVAGTGINGYSGDEGPATAADLSYVYGITLDTCGNLYIADKNNHRIRKINFNTSCVPVNTTIITILNNLNIYPNPVNDILNIEGLTTPAPYRLLNILGSLFQQGNLKAGSNSISLQALPAGVYVLEIVQRDGVRVVKRVVKE